MRNHYEDKKQRRKYIYLKDAPLGPYFLHHITVTQLCIHPYYHTNVHLCYLCFNNARIYDHIMRHPIIYLSQSFYHAFSRKATPWWSGYHYCLSSFNKAWTQVLSSFKPCSQRVTDLRWWESLSKVPVGNKVKRFL